MEKQRKRLFVDMDGTIVPFRKIEIVDMEGLLTAKDYLNSKGYFLNLPIHRNVVDAIKTLIKDHSDEIEVFICSAVYDDAPYAKDDKNEFLDRNLPEIDREHRIFTICGQDKKDFIVGGVREDDYLLDDYTNNLNLWQPPAKGVKLLNGINHTNETWKGDMISYQKNPQNIVDNILNIMLKGEHVQDKAPSLKEEYQIIHSVTANPVNVLLGDEKEAVLYENQKEAVKNLWEKITSDPKFVALEFEKNDITYILSKSTRYGFDFQLSSMDKNLVPLGHQDLLRESAKSERDGFWYSGVADYLAQFHGDLDSILTVKIVKNDKVQDFDLNKFSSLNADERSSYVRELGSFEEGKELLIRQERAKMRDMEHHLMDLKQSFKGEEFKLFYDCVYVPQKHLTEKIAGVELEYAELNDYRDKVDSTLFILAERLAVNLNKEQALGLTIPEMEKFVQENFDDLNRGNSDRIRELLTMAVQKHDIFTLDIILEYTMEIPQQQLPIENILGAPSFEGALFNQQLGIPELQSLISDFQNKVSSIQRELSGLYDRTSDMNNPDFDYGFGISTPAGVAKQLMLNQISSLNECVSRFSVTATMTMERQSMGKEAVKKETVYDVSLNENDRKIEEDIPATENKPLLTKEAKQRYEKSPSDKSKTSHQAPKKESIERTDR